MVNAIFAFLLGNKTRVVATIVGAVFLVSLSGFLAFNFGKIQATAVKEAEIQKLKDDNQAIVGNLQTELGLANQNTKNIATAFNNITEQQKQIAQEQRNLSVSLAQTQREVSRIRREINEKKPQIIGQCDATVNPDRYFGLLNDIANQGRVTQRQ